MFLHRKGWFPFSYTQPHHSKLDHLERYDSGERWLFLTFDPFNERNASSISHQSFKISPTATISVICWKVKDCFHVDTHMPPFPFSICLPKNQTPFTPETQSHSSSWWTAEWHLHRSLFPSLFPTPTAVLMNSHKTNTSQLSSCFLCLICFFLCILSSLSVALPAALSSYLKLTAPAPVSLTS